jgi:hypothetical protein
MGVGDDWPASVIFLQTAAASIRRMKGFRNLDRHAMFNPLRLLGRSTPHCGIQYRFFPVGQGLFSAGLLELGDRNPFAWVFDCGTSSRRKFLRSAVADFRDWHKGPIGLLALSHFDEDHVNGACSLMRASHVRVLMLPYVTFVERIGLALDAEIRPEDPLWSVFLNPAAYFLERFPGLDRILFVPPSGDVPASSEEGTAAREGSVLDDYLDYDPGSPPPDGGPGAPTLKDSGGRVVWLRPGGTIRHRGTWEFVPYNDAVPQLRPLDLATAVAFMRDRDKASLDKLREAYDQAFGTGSCPKNAISLFLYAGPVAGTGARPKPWPFVAYEGRRAYAVSFEVGVPGWLATGDGYLDTPARVGRLLGYLGRDRVAVARIFQVMHHGAEGNWCTEVAAKIKPSVSVFCSNPSDGRYGHPDAAVWNDFRNHGRVVQVDQTRECWIAGPLPR